MTINGPLIDPVVTVAWSADALLVAVLACICLGLVIGAAASVVLQRRHRLKGAVRLNGHLANGQLALARLDRTIWTWSGLLALFMLAGVLGRGAVVAAFAAVSFGALREFFSLIHTRRADHWALLAAFFVVLPAQYGLVAVNWYGLFAVLLPVYAFLLMPVIPAWRGDTTRYMDRVAEVQWGLMISVYCLSHVPALLSLDIAGFDGRQTLLLVYLIIIATLADQIRAEAATAEAAAAGVAGAAVAPGNPGGLVPSPLELAAALGTGLAAGCVLSPVTPFPLAVSAGLGLVIAAMGIAGRLVLAAIKRDRGVIDWTQGPRPGRVAGATPAEADVEPSGGLLDRLDALIFAAPVFFHLTRFLFTP
jgi:phosphatidate cytidylyltransferase